LPKVEKKSCKKVEKVYKDQNSETGRRRRRRRRRRRFVAPRPGTTLSHLVKTNNTVEDCSTLWHLC
jgi:hypothetical protein